MPKKTSAPKKVLDAKLAEKQAEKDAKSQGKQMNGGKQVKGTAKPTDKKATKGSGIKAGEYRPG